LPRRIERQKRARMTHVDFPLDDHALDLAVEVEQTNEIADGRTRAADRLRDLLMRQRELIGEPLQRVRLVDRVQVLALEVLDQRNGERGLIVELANDDRYRGQPGDLRGLP